MTIKNREFQVHKLNEQGIQRCEQIAKLFDEFLIQLDSILHEAPFHDPRLNAIVRTKLEEACFFAKKAIATSEINQINEETK